MKNRNCQPFISRDTECIIVLYALSIKSRRNQMGICFVFTPISHHNVLEYYYLKFVNIAWVEYAFDIDLFTYLKMLNKY